MRLKCLFIERHGAAQGDDPELLQAWDEWTIAENEEGWLAACQESLDACKGDVARKAFVYIEVPTHQILKALRPPEPEIVATKVEPA